METELHPTEQESQTKFLDMLGHSSCGAHQRVLNKQGNTAVWKPAFSKSQSRKQLSYHGHMQNPDLTKGGKKRRKKGRHAFFPRGNSITDNCSYCCINDANISAPLYPQILPGGKAQSSPAYSTLNNPQVHSVAYRLHLFVQKTPQQPSQAVQLSVPTASGQV